MTYDAWHYINLIEGHQLQLTNADGTKTYVAIYLHENRLYIVDATVPGQLARAGHLPAEPGYARREGRPACATTRSTRIGRRLLRRDRRGAPAATRPAVVVVVADAAVRSKRDLRTSSNSISKTSVALGGITPP